MEMNEVIDIIFLGCGIYLIFTAIMAKKKGEIAENVMLDKNTTEKNITDREGYINYISRGLVISGALIIVSAIVNLVNDELYSSVALNWVGIILILAAIVIYTVIYKKGQKLYTDKKKEMP
jgi:CBS domain containing-hemolysin-like protein